MSTTVDWFTYYLHPERLHQDFDGQNTTQPWGHVAKERHAAGVKVLQGLFGTGHFQEYIISAYPELSKGTTYTGPTPPSTPHETSIGEVGSVGRVGQCARFGMASDTGLPSNPLTSVLRANELPELSTKQRRLLSMATTLTNLVGFTVEDIEGAVHAAVRFVYYLYLLENSNGAASDEHRFQYRRWTVRAAYREEEAGMIMCVERGTGIDVNCKQLKTHMGLLATTNAQAKDERFRVAYDLGRVYLAQQRVDEALGMFRECQVLDPGRCRKQRFGLTSGNPSIDEYAEACAVISGAGGSGEVRSGTPVGEFGTMSISPPLPMIHSIHWPQASMMTQNRYDDALRQCVADVLASDGMSAWLSAVHPRVMDHCLQMTADERNRTRLQLGKYAREWVATNGRSAERMGVLSGRAQSLLLLLTGTEDDGGSGGAVHVGDGRRTVAEDQLCASETMDLDCSKPGLATVRVAYSYLSGLRLLEREDFAGAHTWFVQGQAAMRGFTEPETHVQQAPVMMAQHAEKDKALRAALKAQLDVHGRLAGVLEQINRGTPVDAMADEIDAVLAAQTPIRFEFLEHLIMECLRRDAKTVFTRLVGTIATNQKLYQQLPEIHIAVLQIASLLIVVRDTLAAAHVDVPGIVHGTCEAVEEIPAEQLAKVRKSVADIAALLLKIPLGTTTKPGGAQLSMRVVVGCAPQVGAQPENEIERFCRMWGDPMYVALLGALLGEMVHDGSARVGPGALCGLATQIVRAGPEDGTIVDDLVVGAAGTDEKTRSGNARKHLLDIAYTVLRRAVHAVPSSTGVWLQFSAVAGELQLGPQALAMFVEGVALHTQGFAPELLAQTVGEQWFQVRLVPMVSVLAELGLSGAAAALHQCATNVAYDAAVPLLVQAFERKEIDFQVAGFFWDSNLIEYGQYLACLPSAAALVGVRFAVPGSELQQSWPLLMASLFAWLASRLSLHL
ncbi:hypothetical protein EV175_002121 [Coemansia sp. RSA 1933]|nr:hypothetical protein EV175_002121 [Coemansia sp. RSA 1933]